MQIDILTLFPDMFKGPFDESILRRAQDKSFVKINIYNLRGWATDKRKTVDDRPYGGGKGMVMRVDIIDRALTKLKAKSLKLKAKIILLTPQGKTFDQQTASRLAKLNQLILVSGHYEGFDERVRKLVDMEISIGNYVLTGGELPAMVITDAIVRLLPGVLSKEAVKNESFSSPAEALPDRPASPNRGEQAGLAKEGSQPIDLTTYLSNHLLFDYPQYTRPPVYKGMKVPSILLSGDHKKIQAWRRKKQVVSRS